MIQIKLDEEIVLNLQRLSIEIASRKEIISYILTKDIDISTERFNKYQDEYQKYFFEYAQSKKVLENTILADAVEHKKIKNWKIDFDTCEVIIYIEN